MSFAASLTKQLTIPIDCETMTSGKYMDYGSLVIFNLCPSPLIILSHLLRQSYSVYSATKVYENNLVGR